MSEHNSTYRKIGRKSSWAAWWKHMRRKGKRQAHKDCRAEAKRELRKLTDE